jgi:hypothetical protein
MTDCTLVTLEVVVQPVGLLTIEVLDNETAKLEVDLQSSPANVDILVGGVGGAGNAGPAGTDGADGQDGTDGVDGRSFIWCGPYDGSTTYDADDVVFDQDSSWICILSTTGNAPPLFPNESDAFWQLMARRGHDGQDGENGERGQDGENAEEGGTDVATVQAIAAGSTLGLEQALLANDGQAAKTVLAVGATNTGKVQGVSLGSGNVVEVYANGASFNSGIVLYREFMNFAEPICFTGLSEGAIITSQQGFYGASEQYDAVEGHGPMPLLSFGLSFEKTFLYGFRSFGVNEGLIRVINGPLDNTITLTHGDGSPVLDAHSAAQENIALAPWQAITLTGDGEFEYILSGTRPMMACVQSRMVEPRFRDNRLVMPLTNDGITWTRRGFVSALYQDTSVGWYTRSGASGLLNGAGNGVSPGAPVDLESAPPLGTGTNTNNYQPDGACRFRATGLISGYSGADGAGFEATPLMPVSAMSQVVAQPFHIGDVGAGDETGIVLASCYECEAKYYEYDETSGRAIETYHLQLTREPTINLDVPEKQFHPAAAALSNDVGVSGVFELTGPLKPGVIVASAPVMMIAQNADVDLQPDIRSQNGTTTTSIITEFDETLMLGWTPESLRAEIRQDAAGYSRLRSIDGAGTETWVLT